MKATLLALVLLAGCAGAPDKPADPRLIDAANIGLCMIRAANGDCSTPCATASAASCPNLQPGATNQDVANALPNCAISEGSAKAFAFLSAYKTIQCSATPQPAVPPPAMVVPAPVTKPLGPAGRT